MFNDLVYAGNEVLALVKKQYPQAQTRDASDFFHTERFEVAIEDVEPKDFYIFAVKEGFALVCLGFQLRMRGKDTFPELKGWCEIALGKKIELPSEKGGETECKQSNQA